MDLQTILIPVHLLGFALGVGSATASDITFLRSVKDGTISGDEYGILKSISKVVWTSVALLTLSGSALLLSQFAATGSVPRLGYAYFQLKLTIFTILVINGVVFHKRVFPLMKSIIGSSFRSAETKSHYGLYAFTGAVSITSWYSAFLLAVLGRYLVGFPYALLLNAYLLLVCGAAIVAYLVLNMHADQSKSPLHEIKKVYGRPYVVNLVIAGGILSVALLYQLVAVFF